jgi:TDG/mug DNA glycosylase family protein
MGPHGSGGHDDAVAARRFTKSELDSFRGSVVDDLLDERVRVLFVGINPGLWTAAVNAHFARRGNRFWPALHVAGITPHLVDASDGLRDSDREMLLAAGVGITNLVPVATARADELTREELAAGATRLAQLVGATQPRVVAVLGLTAYRQAFADRTAVQGRQERRVGAAALWVLPNPSGLNAHETVATLARSYAEAARDAGVATRL